MFFSCLGPAFIDFSLPKENICKTHTLIKPRVSGKKNSVTSPCVCVRECLPLCGFALESNPLPGYVGFRFKYGGFQFSKHKFKPKKKSPGIFSDEPRAWNDHQMMSTLLATTKDVHSSTKIDSRDLQCHYRASRYLLYGRFRRRLGARSPRWVFLGFHAFLEGLM